MDDPQSRGLRRICTSSSSGIVALSCPLPAFLNRFADATAAPLEASTARVRAPGDRRLRKRAVVQGAPDAARWLKALRPEQVDELFASFAEHENEVRGTLRREPAERACTPRSVSSSRRGLDRKFAQFVT
jgi:hypothetical protein